MQPARSYEPAATVISLVPFPIDEFKPGMSPDEFHLDAAPEGGFTMLLVKKCKHGVYLDENRPTLIVPTAPEEVAQAICFDYQKGMMGVRLGEVEPGLFWVPGDYTTEEGRKTVKAVFAAEFREAERKQHEWFKALVSQADDAWSKFHMRSMISNLQRVAAQRLKLNREWLLEGEVEKALSECPVCFEKVHPKAIICRSCNAVLNQKEYDKIKFAEKGATATATK